MINKKYAYAQKNKGFTLIEVLVAIFILITAVVVPLTIGSKAFAYSNFVRDQSTASYLAQEAVERIRVVRDNAFLTGNVSAWQDFKNATSNCNVDKADKDPGCFFNAQESDFRPDICKTDGCAPLFLQRDGRYSYNGEESNKAFVRRVGTYVENPGTPLERMRVSVSITWNTGGISERSFKVIDYLMPWQI